MKLKSLWAAGNRSEQVPPPLISLFHPTQPVDREQPDFDTATEEVVSSLFISQTQRTCPKLQRYSSFLHQPSVGAAKVEPGSFAFFLGLQIRNYICLD